MPLFVSVIVPVYNGERYLRQALESVEKQDYQPLQVVIVDDGSVDGTAKIAAHCKVDTCYLYQANSGIAAARNRAVQAAQGDVVAFIDADDLWPAGKLPQQVLRLSAEPRVDMVLGRVQMISHTEGSIEPLLDPFLSVNLGSMIVRKSVFDAVGPFDATLRTSEDTDWFLRALEHQVPFAVLPQVTLLYRIHAANVSRVREQRLKDFAAALKKSLDRRRQDNGTGSPLPTLSDHG